MASDWSREQLNALAEHERVGALLALVRAGVADLLGYESLDEVAADVAFTELGFDSLAAVELASQLVEATAVDVPETALFDHPTPIAVARFLSNRLGGGRVQPDPAGPVGEATTGDDPVAIVGMACRLPGGVDFAGRPVGAAARRGRRHLAVSQRSRLGSRAAVPHRSRPPWDQLRP